MNFFQKVIRYKKGYLPNKETALLSYILITIFLSFREFGSA
ncbi:hypothetical protein HMPREF3034_01957 [Prevotella sp. DNF00663]|nr:hypothetical protein HMPREF3034_01957 [Prevotella sp. DNF00663]